MKRDYFRLLVLAAVLVLPLLFGNMFRGDGTRHAAPGDVVYAEEEHGEHCDHEDCGEHGSHAGNTEKLEHDDHEDCGEHGTHAGDSEKIGHDKAVECGHQDNQGERGDHEGHESHAEAELGENEEQNHIESSGHSGHEPSDQHAGHEHGGGDIHASHQHESAGEEHEGHDHRGEDLVRLSPGAVRLAGIKVATARMGRIRRTIELPGEIGFNEDRLVHVTPRFPGVAREVHGQIGAYVREGDLLAVLESNESLSRYNVTAPISGRIIEKHLAVGEFVTEDHDMFLVADLSTVWANCEVYARDVANVKQGARVRINAVAGGHSTEAILSYVAPVYDGETRSALARAVIVNDGDFWRPGTFIRAELHLETEGERLTVAKDAIQTVGEEKVVFVPAEEEGAFELVPVVTGTRDDHSVEILSGLAEGAPYVADGAFELKAKMVTANMGAHAGHGH